MNSISFGFRDYAVHLFPGSLVVSALLFLGFNLDWIEPKVAPMLILLYLLGGYIVGFFLETVTTVCGLNKLIWKVSGRDPLIDYFKNVRLNGDPHDLKDNAAQILYRNFGEAFIRETKFSTHMYFMMRDIEARNERSSAFISRINALENLAKNLGVACAWVAAIAFLNVLFFLDQWLISILALAFFSVMCVLLLRRRVEYRAWLAKSVIRSFVALDLQFNASKSPE